MNCICHLNQWIFCFLKGEICAAKSSTYQVSSGFYGIQNLILLRAYMFNFLSIIF